MTTTHDTVAPPNAITVSSTQITREIAQKVLATIDEGLSRGPGQPVPGKMCVEAAVSFALGLPHGDGPGCVARSLRTFKIVLNDARWSSPQARARGLRRLGLAQLGSHLDFDEIEFAHRVLRLAMTRQVPAALRAAASVHRNPMHVAALNQAASECERQANAGVFLNAKEVARTAYLDPTAGTWSPAESACLAANAMLEATDELGAGAVVKAASAAIYAADAAQLAFGGDARDDSLAAFAETVVQVLIEMRAPGCQWLDLTEAPSLKLADQRTR